VEDAGVLAPRRRLVIDREVREEYDSDGARSHAPIVRYRYTVEGRE